MGGEVDGEGRGEGFALGVVGRGGEAELDGGAIGFTVAREELGEAGSAADDEGEDARGEGVESAEVADLAGAGEAANAIDGIMGSPGGGLIENEDAREGRRFGEQDEKKEGPF